MDRTDSSNQGNLGKFTYLLGSLLALLIVAVFIGSDMPAPIITPVTIDTALASERLFSLSWLSWPVFPLPVEFSESLMLVILSVLFVGIQARIASKCV